MTTYIPSLTLPKEVFAQPAVSILLPVALGTSIGFITRRTYILLLDYTVCSCPCSQGDPEDIHGAEAAPISTSSSSLRSSLDGALRAHGILCVQSLGYWDVIAESKHRFTDQSTIPFPLRKQLSTNT